MKALKIIAIAGYFLTLIVAVLCSVALEGILLLALITGFITVFFLMILD